MVETVPFGLLYPALLAVAPNTATPWLDYYLGQAVADLALKTRVVRHVVTHDLQAGVDTYPIDIPKGYILAYVERVCVAGTEYTLHRRTNCAPVAPGRGACETTLLSSAGCAIARNNTYSATADGLEIFLSPTPAQDHDFALEIEVSIAPERNACAMPKILYDRYSTAIISSAISSMAMNESLKLAPRTIAIATRRAEVAERRAKLEADSQMSVGTDTMEPPVSSFLT